MMLLWKTFLVFTRVSLFSWGGGPASLALMQRETTGQGWVTPPEFADAVALGNALPGPIAPQVSAYIGYKLAGVPGAVAAAGGTVLPATILMLVLVALFFNIKNSQAVQAMLKAVRPVVVGLLLWTTYDMGRTVFGAGRGSGMSSMLREWDKLVIAAVAFGLLTFTRVNPAYIILGAAALGFGLYR